ncbi:hypothetical protein VNO77_42911 [Canavalia gladiata]|uniref:PPC domain-containing protein n=1 Tax=Canavalia gladiata TaxID=3824 RepID=A0AAN9PPK2_CANGL
MFSLRCLSVNSIVHTLRRIESAFCSFDFALVLLYFRMPEECTFSTKRIVIVKPSSSTDKLFVVGYCTFAKGNKTNRFKWIQRVQGKGNLNRLNIAKRKQRGIFILGGNGIVTNVILRQPASSGSIVTLHGGFEILSLLGSVFPPPASLGITVYNLLGRASSGWCTDC